MYAAWYEKNGVAAEVMKTGELPDIEPAAGEVRVRLYASAVNPSDVKARGGSRPIRWPKLIPNSDGAGIVDQVGAGVRHRPEEARRRSGIGVTGRAAVRTLGSGQSKASSRLLRAERTCMRYTDRLADAGIAPSVGSQGDAYDNALAESVIGLFKTEVIQRKGPWRSLEAVEFATLVWVDWFNNRRLLGPIGDIPPAEFEALYYAQAKVA